MQSLQELIRCAIIRHMSGWQWQVEPRNISSVIQGSVSLLERWIGGIVTPKDDALGKYLITSGRLAHPVNQVLSGFKIDLL